MNLFVFKIMKAVSYFWTAACYSGAGLEPAGRTVRNLQKSVKVRPTVCPAGKTERESYWLIKQNLLNQP